MTTVADLLVYLDRAAPFAGAAEWDAVGLQIGDPSSALERAGVCHEVTREVVDHLMVEPAEVLVSYHSLLFEPTRSLVAGDTPEGISLALARLGVALIVVHTAFDVAEDGGADALATALGLDDVTPLSEPDENARPLGRMGTSRTTVRELAARVSMQLGVTARLADATRGGTRQPDTDRQRVAVVPGSGSSFIEAAAAAGATVLVTGDVSHHRAQQARAIGLSLIDAGHIPTERPGLAKLVQLVEGALDVVDLTHLDPHPWEPIDG